MASAVVSRRVQNAASLDQITPTSMAYAIGTSLRLPIKVWQTRPLSYGPALPGPRPIVAVGPSPLPALRLAVVMRSTTVNKSEC